MAVNIATVTLVCLISYVELILPANPTIQCDGQSNEPNTYFECILNPNIPLNLLGLGLSIPSVY